MSELPDRGPEQAFNSAKMLKTMYETGAEQLYEEETGKVAIENGARTSDAQTWVDSKLAPINFEDRKNWQINADLEMSLSQACSRRLGSPLQKQEMPLDT